MKIATFFDTTIFSVLLPVGTTIVELQEGDVITGFDYLITDLDYNYGYDLYEYADAIEMPMIVIGDCVIGDCVVEKSHCKVLHRPFTLHQFNKAWRQLIGRSKYVL